MHLPGDINDQMRVRIDKIDALRSAGHHPYAERYDRTHTLREAGSLPDNTAGVRIAGRITGLRYFGKLAFGHLHDLSGRIQFALQKKRLADRFTAFKELVDIGDFIGIDGSIMTTRTGEKTLDVGSWAFLSKAVRPLPEKFHGLTDPDLRFRRRYLDLITSPAVRERFVKRTEIIRAIRDFLDGNGFLEIDTPVLTGTASGAIARPFITHHTMLDMDVYLRIAPETYLKRAVAGGFDRVYEFARSFRNEGLDSSHLPDFTLLEYYCAYWNFEDNMRFTEELLKNLLRRVNGALRIEYNGTAIDFDGTWPRVRFRDLILKDSGIDIDRFEDRGSLLAELSSRGISFDEEIEGASRATLVDLLYKKVSRPALIAPVFVTHHPIALSPLARRSDADPRVVDRFQLVVNGWEIVNAYSELIDPLDQRGRFMEQARARAQGDEESMELDEDFLRCMEYGMPPVSGWGMGIDRLVALLTNAASLREVILFPLMRSE